MFSIADLIESIVVDAKYNNKREERDCVSRFMNLQKTSAYTKGLCEISALFERHLIGPKRGGIEFLSDCVLELGTGSDLLEIG